jgi:hypothetical protein
VTKIFKLQMTHAKKFFVNNDLNVFFVDNGLLYEHELFRINPFHGFLDDIQNCFHVGFCYMVHTKNSLVCFDMERNMLGVIDGMNFSIKKIIFVDNIFYILTSDNVFHVCGFDLSDDGSIGCHIMASFNHTKIFKKEIDVHFKIIDHMLLLFLDYNDSVYVINIHDYLSNYSSSNSDRDGPSIAHFGMKYSEFRKITSIVRVVNTSSHRHNNLNRGISTNGSSYEILMSDNKYFIVDLLFSIHDDNKIDLSIIEQQVYMFMGCASIITLKKIMKNFIKIDTDNQFAKINIYTSVKFIKVLLDNNTMKKITITTAMYPCDIRQSNILLELKINITTGITIIDHSTTHICILYENTLIIINIMMGTIDELSLDDSMISYSDLIDKFTNLSDPGEDSSDKSEICIDININKSVCEQLLVIIPAIYRNNRQKQFVFEQILNDQIISWGSGVSRQIFTTLAEEIDHIFEIKFENFTSDTAFELGKLFWFNIIHGNVRFKKIQSYFFYLLSNKIGIYRNIKYLLEKFKNDDGLLYKQFLRYQKDNSELLEMDIKSIDDYVRYLFSAGLSQTEIKLYNSFFEGFMFYFDRSSPRKQLIRFHIKFFADIILDEYRTDPAFIFKSLHNNLLDELTINFKKSFTDIVISQSHQQIFYKNITGSKYYKDPISVILDYEPVEIIGQQQIFDENEIIDEDIIDAHQFQSTNVTLLLEPPKISTIYEISTCGAQITINVPPTKDNCDMILKYLCVPDDTLYK